MTTEAALDHAKSFGLQDREAYGDEFGEEPVIGKVGDWDAAAWGETWSALRTGFDIEPNDFDSYNELKAAYFKALFATDEAG